MKRLRLYSVKDGRKISAVEGNVRTVLSMLTLPGLRESVVITRLSLIKEVAENITTTDLKNSHGDIIHQAKLEQDCSLQYVVILDDKKMRKLLSARLLASGTKTSNSILWKKKQMLNAFCFLK